MWCSLKFIDDGIIVVFTKYVPLSMIGTSLCTSVQVPYYTVLSFHVLYWFNHYISITDDSTIMFLVLVVLISFNYQNLKFYSG